MGPTGKVALYNQQRRELQAANQSARVNDRVEFLCKTVPPDQDATQVPWESRTGSVQKVIRDGKTVKDVIVTWDEGVPVPPEHRTSFTGIPDVPNELFYMKPPRYFKRPVQPEQHNEQSSENEPGPYRDSPAGQAHSEDVNRRRTPKRRASEDEQVSVQEEVFSRKKARKVGELPFQPAKRKQRNAPSERDISEQDEDESSEDESSSESFQEQKRRKRHRRDSAAKSKRRRVDWDFTSSEEESTSKLRRQNADHESASSEEEARRKSKHHRRDTPRLEKDEKKLKRRRTSRDSSSSDEEISRSKRRRAERYTSSDESDSDVESSTDDSNVVLGRNAAKLAEFFTNTTKERNWFQLPNSQIRVPRNPSDGYKCLYPHVFLPKTLKVKHTQPSVAAFKAELRDLLARSEFQTASPIAHAMAEIFQIQMVSWIRSHSKQKDPTADDWRFALAASTGIVLQLAFAKGGKNGFKVATTKLSAAREREEYHFLEILNAVTETSFNDRDKEHKGFRPFRGRKKNNFNGNQNKQRKKPDKQEP
jgi:hypothetical protein